MLEFTETEGKIVFYDLKGSASIFSVTIHSSKSHPWTFSPS